MKTWLVTFYLNTKMPPKESLGKSEAGQIRERLLADYVDIWENIYESDGFIDWAYNNSVSKLYIHAAPQCGKVSRPL